MENNGYTLNITKDKDNQGGKLLPLFSCLNHYNKDVFAPKNKQGVLISRQIQKYPKSIKLILFLEVKMA